MSDWNYIFKIAWRDSRRNRSKLLMFVSSIILGITALVAINSFNYNLVRDIDEQAKSLLGADLVIKGNKPLSDSLRIIADSIPGERASEIELFSMAYFPSKDETQFVRIRAVEGDFPFYGKIKTLPEDFGTAYQEEPVVIADEGMMIEYGLELGDSIKLGNKSFKIGARLLSIFGGVSLGSGFAPTVYMGKEFLNETELVQPGSMLDYSWFYKTPPEFDPEEWESLESRRQKFRNENFRSTTMEDQKENLDQAFGNLNSFLNLIALVSLILGCIGVASSVFIYIKSKIPSIAIFRCLGMTGSQAFRVYFVQIFVLGTMAVLAGILLGSLVQIALPAILEDLLPYTVDLQLSWKAMGEGLVIGLVMTALFATVPLLSVREVSPLRTLRASVETGQIRRSKMAWLIYSLIVVFLFLFLWNLTSDVKIAGMFTLGLIAAFGILYGVSVLIMFMLKRYFPSGWSFVFRQGLANLYRPNNQTRTLIVSIGLGTAILTLLYIIQGLLLTNVASMEAGNQPNMILYGIETEQKDSVARLTQEYDMPLIQQVPIVTMKLAAWEGKTRAEWMADTTRTASRWAANREARVSYRDTLNDDEELIEGEFVGRVEPGDSVFISLDQGYAESLDVGIGDELIWNVQGALIKTYISSIRDIEFRSMRTRFFILFPEGVLENAPQFHVLVTKSPDNETLAAYRRDVVRAFPNVSVVDLGSILETLNDILSKISYVIKFMAGFSILTGIIVLISSLLLSKYQRIQESVLLRTIGALKAQILQINATEYALLGSLSAVTGILIALVGSYLLARFQLDLDFNIIWWPILIIFLGITGLTVLIGLINSREVITQSPLEVLRKEVG